MTHTDIKKQPLTIEGIEKSVVISYFVTINQAKFEQTATLFAENGVLLAPFESAIIGRNAIALYLSREAKGMKLLPRTGICESFKNDTEEIKVTGKVKTHLFSVNVAWNFTLDINQQIATAKIKLLASPKELLGLREIRGNR